MSVHSRALVPLCTEQQAAWRAVAETEKRRHQGNTLAEYPYPHDTGNVRSFHGGTGVCRCG